jgi:hypothetical protein
MKIKNTISYENYFKSAIVALALIFLSYSIWSFVRTSPGVDFYISWIGVMSIREQKCLNIYETEKGVQVRESFYLRSTGTSVPPRQKMVAQCWQDYEKIFYKNRSAENRLLFFFNTPFLYTCLQLFVSGDYERDISLYYLVQLVCFIFFIFIVMCLLKIPFVSIFYPAILFTVFYGPFLCDMRVGNVVLMQLAFIALFLSFAHLIRKKDIGLLLGGAVLGLMVFFKPNMIFVPFMLIVGWLVLRQFRHAILSSVGMIVGSILALSSAAMFFSTFRVWFWWFKAACNVSNLPYVTVGEGNFALSKVLGEMCGMQKLPFVFLFIFLTVIIAMALFLRNKNISKPFNASPSFPEENILMVSIGCLLYLLCSPLVWIHYYMLVIPALMYIGRPMPKMRGCQQVPIYSLALMSYCFICMAGRTDVTGFSMTVSAILCNIGTICLLSCLLWLWYSGYSNKNAPS